MWGSGPRPCRRPKPGVSPRVGAPLQKHKYEGHSDETELDPDPAGKCGPLGRWMGSPDSRPAVTFSSTCCCPLRRTGPPTPRVHPGLRPARAGSSLAKAGRAVEEPWRAAPSLAGAPGPLAGLLLSLEVAEHAPRVTCKARPLGTPRAAAILAFTAQRRGTEPMAQPQSRPPALRPPP